MQLAVLAFFLACLPQTPLKLEQHDMREAGNDYSIHVEYPQIPNNPEFNRAVREAIKSLAEDVRRNSFPGDPNGRLRNSLNGSYKAAVLKNGIVSVLLDYSEDASTAVHPWGVMAVVNYDSKRCHVLRLADLFRPEANYVQRISQLAIASLERNEYAESSAIQHGAGPVESNFK